MGLSVRVFERGSSVGGTWYWNRYPGARCDLPSLEYSYSFDEALQQDWEWSEVYPSQEELERYANHVADRFDLRRSISFDTRVTSATYDPDACRWAVETDSGARAVASHLILATGNLSMPQLPDIPGVEGFAGRTFHTGLWPSDGVDFSGRRVGVIGTGSSGVQVIPQVARSASHLTVFQRTANYSIPARNAPLEPEAQAAHKARYGEIRQEALVTPFGIAKYGSPSVSAFEVSDEERQRTYEACWEMGGQAMLFAYNDLLKCADANETAARFVRQRIREKLVEPAVADLLVPTDHPIGAKRLCLDTDYYETYNRHNVTLVCVKQTPIRRIDPDGVSVGGERHPIDDLVLATGFDAMTGAARSIDIRNSDGLSLADEWESGPRSYLGLMVAGFPNMYLITGPQSPSVKSQMILASEHHVDIIAGIVQTMRAEGHRSVEAVAEAQEEWVGHANEVADATLYTKASTWYNGANVPGKPRVFMPYVGGVKAYREACEDVEHDGWRGFRFQH